MRWLGFFLVFMLSANVALAANTTDDRLMRIRYRIEQRREVREKRLEAMQEKKLERKSDRISKLRGSQITQKSVTRRSLQRSSRLRDLSIRKTNTPINQYTNTPSKQETDNPTERLLPNQSFTPTLPLPNIDATSSFLILGERAPVVASINITPDDEPVEIREIKITLTSEVSSIISFEVFDDIGYVLGSATLDIAESANRDVFSLDLSTNRAYFIDKDDQVTLAIRPILTDRNSGGVSGETVQVSDIDITAVGQWSSRNSSVTNSGPDFQKHKTALAKLSSIENSGAENGTFSIGTNKLIASFDFAAHSISAREADPALESLTFAANAPSMVVLSNVVLQANGSNTTSACTFSRPEITCSSIPAEIGSLQSARTILLYADISLSGTHPNTFMQIEINRPGNPESTGGITWSDGETSFGWIKSASPVVRGTDWR